MTSGPSDRPLPVVFVIWRQRITCATFGVMGSTKTTEFKTLLRIDEFGATIRVCRHASRNHVQVTKFANGGDPKVIDVEIAPLRGRQVKKMLASWREYQRDPLGDEWRCVIGKK
jgi:hypothetical protein